MRRGKETEFDFRSHPSLAPDLVAGLQDLPTRTTVPGDQGNGTRLSENGRMVSAQDHKAETIRSQVADQKYIRKPRPFIYEISTGYK
jgi:hypothetical protein